ncbi:MAG: phosphoribosylglycinamide formyltransferase [Candidatus Marinimicrobia bacterium]|nr:phosphoribosylglycinamide formyltransferase [Candidatus Neomarinimicrobiota bacterium]
MLKLAVLGSTRGTDLDAIVSAIDEGILNATIKLVISNKENAYILKRAEKNNIKSMFLSDYSVTREEYGNLLNKIFIDNNVDIVLLIGFMRILSKSFCKKWDNKILNVHPSLLPKYAGGINNNVHRDVLKNKDSETGCTIHYVTANVDSGPILIQKKCEVQPGDTIESLKDRVQDLEGQAFIEALHLIENKNYA